MRMSKNIGIQINAPEGECNDNKCPFHGELSCYGSVFTGVVTSTKMHKTSSVEWKWHKYIQKYERYEQKRTRVKAHNTPCINAKEGDIVKIIRCRPLSKTKNFVIVERLGRDIAYMVKKETSKDIKEEPSQHPDKNATSKSKNN